MDKPLRFQSIVPFEKSSCKGLSCGCCLLPILVFLALHVFLGIFVLSVSNRHYENKTKARFFVGGRNESCHLERSRVCLVEADMDMNTFKKYAVSEAFHLLPIDNDGIDIFCYKFRSICPSQRDSYNSGTGKDIATYVHHVAQGFYSSKQVDGEMTYEGTRINKISLIVYGASITTRRTVAWDFFDRSRCFFFLSLKCPIP